MEPTCDVEFLNTESTTLLNSNNNQKNLFDKQAIKNEYNMETLNNENYETVKFFEKNDKQKSKNCIETKTNINESDLINTLSNENNENTDDEYEEEDNYECDPEYIVQLESWLAFKGAFDSMQALTRLRFKLMSYFLNVLKNPSNESTEENLVLIISY